MYIIASLRTHSGYINSLQVSTKSVDLVHDEVHVRIGRVQVADDEAEEVDALAQRLVANQHRSLLHHPLLDFRRNLKTTPEVLIEANKELKITR